VGGKDEQGVEPTSCLIDTFRHESGGKCLLEELLVFEGIMKLGIRHTARLEPAVEDLINTLEIPFTFLRWDGNVVDLVSVDVGDAFDARQFL